MEPSDVRWRFSVAALESNFRCCLLPRLDVLSFTSDNGIKYWALSVGWLTACLDFYAFKE